VALIKSDMAKYAKAIRDSGARPDWLQQMQATISNHSILQFNARRRS
jgi:hypothetical protein